MSDQREIFERRIAEAVESDVGTIVAAGRARVQITPAFGSQGALIEVIPSDPDACPVTIHCDDLGDLDLYVGHHKLTTHISKPREWKRGDFAALEDELCAWLTALVAGRYEEEVRLAENGEAAKGRGTLQLSGGMWRFKYANAATLGKRGPWQRVAYAAY